MDQRVKIIVIDSDPSVRDEICAQLDTLPYPVELATSPERARVILEEPPGGAIIVVAGAQARGEPLLEELLATIRDRVALILLGPARPAAGGGSSVSPRRPVTADTIPCETLLGPLDPGRLRQAVETALARLVPPRTEATSSEATLSVGDPDQEDLAWLGGLAAMLAHELTSPLDGSLRYLRMLRRQIEGGSDLIDYVEEIEHGLGRMERMVRALLAFSRSTSTHRPPRPLDVMLAEAEQQIRQHTPCPDITVEVSGPDTQPLVPADLFQVFTNILRNAFDAMPDGGRLTIDWHRARRGLEMLFEDDGPGLDEEARCRAFEPFYTTKPFGQGTGLGLSICRRLVSGFGGQITLEPSLLRGARVRLIIPLETDEAGSHDREPGR